MIILYTKQILKKILPIMTKSNKFSLKFLKSTKIYSRPYLAPLFVSLLDIFSEHYCFCPMIHSDKYTNSNKEGKVANEYRTWSIVLGPGARKVTKRWILAICS